MFKIAICDDEDFYRNHMYQMLTAYMDKRDIPYEIVTFSSGMEFLELGIEIRNFNIVFLDIYMPKLDGMKTAEKIRSLSKEVFIVFITVVDTFVFEGYKVDAFRYILKNDIHYDKCIYECMDAVFAKKAYITIKRTFNFIEGTKPVLLDKILYVESSLHKLKFYILEDVLNSYTLYKTLNELEKEFAGMNFIRIHQSFLVNMKYITSITRYKVLLKNNLSINIPRSRYKHVAEVYAAYKGEFALSYLDGL